MFEDYILKVAKHNVEICTPVCIETANNQATEPERIIGFYLGDNIALMDVIYNKKLPFLKIIAPGNIYSETFIRLDTIVRFDILSKKTIQNFSDLYPNIPMDHKLLWELEKILTAVEETQEDFDFEVGDVSDAEMKLYLEKIASKKIKHIKLSASDNEDEFNWHSDIYSDSDYEEPIGISDADIDEIFKSKSTVSKADKADKSSTTSKSVKVDNPTKGNADILKLNQPTETKRGRGRPRKS